MSSDELGLGLAYELKNPGFEVAVLKSGEPKGDEMQEEGADDNDESTDSSGDEGRGEAGYSPRDKKGLEGEGDSVLNC